jgi:tetratricopeptide (TPR) repeat protein
MPLLIESLRIQAEALRDLQQLDEALEKIEKSIENCTDQRLPYAEACCWRTLGKIQRDRGFEWADRSGVAFEKALKLFEKHGARHALAVTRREFASFLIEVDEPDLANDQLDQALATFSELDCPEETQMTTAIRDSIAR